MRNYGPNISAYTLSAAQIKQRRGLTGRTCDGVFFLFKIVEPHLEVAPREFSTCDFLSGISPAAQASLKWLPKHIKASMTKAKVEAVPFFDLYKTMDWTTVNNAIRNEAEGIKFVGGLRKWLIRLRTIGPGIMATATLRELELPPFTVDEGEVAEPAPLPKPEPVKPKAEAPVPTPWSRQDVSGAGLLCGARVVAGLVFTHRQLVVPLEEVQLHIRTILDEFGIADTNLFTADTLIAVLWRVWQLPARLIVDGVMQRLFPGLPRDAQDYGTIYLNTAGVGHYNYLGLPLP